MHISKVPIRDLVDVNCGKNRAWHGKAIAKAAESPMSPEEGPIYGSISVNLQMPRIDENRIPNSNDGIFIRGLSSNVDPSEVKDYFTKHGGVCVIVWTKIKGSQLLIALK